MLTVYNLHKPRDRSYYEHFMAYHESFYRYVEAQSVTPFSLPALDRGLAAVLVGLVRHTGGPKAAAPSGAGDAQIVSQQQAHVAALLSARAARQPGGADSGFGPIIGGRATSLSDKWRRIVRPTSESRGSTLSFCYSPWEKKKASATTSLMRTPDHDATLQPSERIPTNDDQFPFVAPTSMRDVEPSTAIWIRRRPKTES